MPLHRFLHFVPALGSPAILLAAFQLNFATLRLFASTNQLSRSTSRQTLTREALVTMAEYTATGPPGAATNGSAMNGSGDGGFAPPAPMPASNEAAKTLWYVALTALLIMKHAD